MENLSEKSKILCKDYVVFLSAWGTGKTALMVQKATELSKKGEKVLFVIITFGRNTTLPTLLVHKLRNTFSENELIEVLHVPYIDGSNHDDFQEMAKKYDHILIDEFFGDFPSLTPQNQAEFVGILKNKKTAWITMANTYWWTMKTNLNQLTDEVKTKWFPFYDFEIVTLNEAPRFSTQVGNEIKIILDQMYGQKMPLNASLFMEASCTNHSSKAVTISQDLVYDLKTIVKACLNELNVKNVLIMVEDLPVTIKPLIGNHKILPLVFNHVFKDLGLESPKYCTIDFSDIEDIEDAFKHNTIVTSYTMAKGIEHGNIINFSTPLTHSRASGNIVNVPPNFNFVFLVLPLIDALQNNHNEFSISPLEWIDAKLESDFKLRRSNIFLNYFHQHNPLINCIFDCIKTDKDQEFDHLPDLLKSIFEHLRKNPNCPFASPTDLQNFKIWNVLSREKTLRKYEDEIIAICCEILKRKIVLLSILQIESAERFGQEFSKEYKIFCLRNLGQFGQFGPLNFYISTQKL